jgi:hypothetical protein
MQRVGLHQKTIQLDTIEELAQCRDLAAGIGGVGVLGYRHPKCVGVQAYLSDKTRCARSGLIDRTPQGLAVTHQGVDALGDARLGFHPLLQQGIEAIDIELREQQTEGRVRWWLGDVGAEQLVEGLAVAFGKTLHPEQRTLVAENGQDRHQQHPPLRVANPPAQAAIGKRLLLRRSLRLEEADQIRCSGWVLEWRGQENWARPAHQTGAERRTPGPPVSGNVPVQLCTPSRPKHPRPNPKPMATLNLGRPGHDR